MHYALLFACCLFLFSACMMTTSAQRTVPSQHCRDKGAVRQTKGVTDLPAAQGEWALFHGNLARDGSAAAGNSKLTLAWTYCTGQGIFSSPIVRDGRVYIATGDAALAALDIQHGQVLWRFQADAPFFSTPIIQDGTIYVCSLEGSIYALDAISGHVRWQAKVATTGAKVWSSPIVFDGLVMVGLASALSEKPKIAGQLIALDAATGKQRWQMFSEVNGAPGGGIWSSPAVDSARGVVYVGTGDPDDGVMALQASSGRSLWHWRSTLHDVADTDVGSGPLLYSDKQGKARVAVGGKDGMVYSLDAETGRLDWHMQLGGGIFGSPAFAHGTIYAVATQSRRSTCWSLDAQTGEVHWHYAIPETVYSSPVISGQALYVAIGNSFGPGDGGVDVLDAANGQLLQYADLHSTATSSPAVIGSWLFVGTNDGNLDAFVR